MYKRQVDTEFVQDGPAVPDGNGKIRRGPRRARRRHQHQHHSQGHRDDRGDGQRAERIVGSGHGDDGVRLMRQVGRSVVDVRVRVLSAAVAAVLTAAPLALSVLEVTGTMWCLPMAW